MGSWYKVVNDEGIVEFKASDSIHNVPEDQIVVNQDNYIEIFTPPIDSTKLYFIDGIVDMGTMSIEIPNEGFQMTGMGFDVSKLTSSEDNYTLFTSPIEGSGNLIFQDMTIEVTGTNSKVFDIVGNTGLEAVEYTRVNYDNCTSLGVIDTYRQGLETGTGRFGGTPELELKGVWVGGYRITTSIVRGVGSTILFTAGVGLAFSGRFLSDLNMEGETDASFTDISPSNIDNDGQFQLENVNFRGVTDPLLNIDGASVKSRFRNCLGIRNTYIGGQWSISASAATSIALANTLYKLSGTTTYIDLQWFSQTVDNSFVYDSSQEIEIEIKGTLSFTGTNGDQVGLTIRQWDNSASAYIGLSESGAVTLNASGRAEGVSVLGFGVINENDRVELWIENKTAGRDITAETNGLFAISERAS